MTDFHSNSAQNHHVQYNVELTPGGVCRHTMSVCLHNDDGSPKKLPNGLPAIWIEARSHSIERKDIDCLLMLHYLFKAMATALVFRLDLPPEQRLPLKDPIT